MFLLADVVHLETMEKYRSPIFLKMMVRVILQT